MFNYLKSKIRLGKKFFEHTYLFRSSLQILSQIRVLCSLINISQVTHSLRSGCVEKCTCFREKCPLLAYFPYFEKIKVGIRDPHSVSVCVCVLPASTFECLNQSLCYLVCVSWHLSPSQRRTSKSPPISLYAYSSYRCYATAR
jgi:hypothetical protein